MTLISIFCWFWCPVYGQRSSWSYSCLFLCESSLLEMGECGRGQGEQGEMSPFSSPWGQCRLHGACKGQGSLCSACTYSKVRLVLAGRAEGILSSWTCCHLPFQPPGWPSAITWAVAVLGWFLGSFLPFSLPLGGWIASSSEWTSSGGTWSHPGHLSLSSDHFQIPLISALRKPGHQLLPYLWRQTCDSEVNRIEGPLLIWVSGNIEPIMDMDQKVW